MDLIQLVVKLPLLMEIEVIAKTDWYSGNAIPVTIDALIKIIENGKRFKYVKFRWVKDLHINKMVIDAILDAMQIDTNLLIQFKGCQHQTSLFVSGDY